MSSSPPPSSSSSTRRVFLQRAGGLACAGAVAGWPLSASAEDSAAPEATIYGSVRLALLLGNRAYPEPFDLPPIPKNVHDVQAALQARGFEVSDGLDLDPAAAFQMLSAFIEKVRAAPPDAVVFFYFSGHGVQIDSTNLLLASGVNPAAHSDTLMKGSLQLLQDVVSKLPDRTAGMTIAVVDACRTSLNTTLGSDDGLNQVEAPPGCLIAFSTGAGRPAIAPAVPNVNTFYTGSLVKMLNTLPGETSFSDLFRLVKTDVEQTMTHFPVAAIRKLAQKPFIADNSRVRVALSRPLAEGAAASRPRFGGVQEQADWARLEASTWPAEVLQLSTAFLADYPSSRLRASAQVEHDGAQEAMKALQRPDVRLFKSAFQMPPTVGADLLHDLRKAARGDKDAAARVGRMVLATRQGGALAGARYEGWLQFATAQGNGIAAYELALHYRDQEQPLLAAQYEARARELGYNPPPSLDNVRK